MLMRPFMVNRSNFQDLQELERPAAALQLIAGQYGWFVWRRTWPPRAVLSRSVRPDQLNLFARSQARPSPPWVHRSAALRPSASISRPPSSREVSGGEHAGAVERTGYLPRRPLCFAELLVT